MLFGLLSSLLFILSLAKTMRQVPESFHQFPHWFFWMMLIPVANFIFAWIMLPFGLPNTLQAAVKENPEALKRARALFSLGLALMITTSALIIPFLGLIAIPGAIVLWIIYWVKAVKIRQYLNFEPSMLVTKTIKVVDKTNMPKAISMATWLILGITFLDITFGTYINIRLASVYIQIIQNLNQGGKLISFAFTPYFLFASVLVNFVIVISCATIMFKGLRNAKRGIYIFTLIFTGLGLLSTAFSLLGAGFSKVLDGNLQALVKPEIAQSISQALESTQTVTILAASVQFSLLIILLVMLLSKKSRAWFRPQ